MRFTVLRTSSWIVKSRSKYALIERRIEGNGTSARSWTAVTELAELPLFGMEPVLLNLSKAFEHADAKAAIPL